MSEQGMDDARVELPIEWHVPENIIRRYASNVVIQHGEHEFTISFFEIKEPLLLGIAKEKLDELESVRAECVAQIVVHPARMQQFIDVMQKNLDRYLQRKQGKQE
jgi:hypothetical protein